MSQPDTDLKTGILKSPPKSLDKHQRVLVSKGDPVKKKIEHISPDITTVS